MLVEKVLPPASFAHRQAASCKAGGDERYSANSTLGQKWAACEGERFLRSQMPEDLREIRRCVRHVRQGRRGMMHLRNDRIVVQRCLIPSL